MEFRPATPGDAEGILLFWKNSGASMSTTDEVGYVQQITQNPAAVLLLAFVGREPVGSLLGTFDGWRGNMYRLVVHPNYRRQGIGRALVRPTVSSVTSVRGSRAAPPRRT